MNPPEIRTELHRLLDFIEPNGFNSQVTHHRSYTYTGERASNPPRRERAYMNPPEIRTELQRLLEFVERHGFNSQEEERKLLLCEHHADSGNNNQEQEEDLEGGLERNNSSQEVVHIDPKHSASMSTAQHVEDNVQGSPRKQTTFEDRCIQYSQKALRFSIPTFIDYAASGSSTGHTVFTKISMAAFFIAICSDLFCLLKKKKPKSSCTLVYVSWFHLVLMTTLIFVSLNKVYVYGILIVPLMIGAALLQYNLWPSQQHQRSTDGELDDVFKQSAEILSWGSLVTAVISIARSVVSGQGNYRTGCAAGFLFFFTVVVGLYLMMVTTVREQELILHAKYLHKLFIGLVVGTLITTLGPIWFH